MHVCATVQICKILFVQELHRVRGDWRVRWKGVVGHCGCMATSVVVLAGEKQEDYDKVARGWNEYWEPADYQEEKLVETLILNDWLHRRAQRWQLAAEARVMGENGPDPMDWPVEQQRKLEAAQRFKAAAERAFYRAWSALRGLGKDIMRDNRREAALQLENDKFKLREDAQKLKAEQTTPKAKSETALTPAQKLFQGQKSPKKRKKIPILDQWVEIEVSPAEKASGTGRLLPYGGNLPRPEERGGCDCPVCSRNRAILEARAA